MKCFFMHRCQVFDVVFQSSDLCNGKCLTEIDFDELVFDKPTYETTCLTNFSEDNEKESWVLMFIDPARLCRSIDVSDSARLCQV